MRKKNNPLFSESAHEAEMYVLGGMMLLSDPTSSTMHKILNALNAQDLYYNPHKLIFNVISTLVKEQVNVDIVSVSEYLERIGRDQDVGGIAYLADLCKVVASTSNVLNYVSLVRKDSLRRSLHSFALNMQMEINEQSDLNQYIGQLLIRIDALRVGGLTAHSYAHIKTFIDKWYEEYQMRFNEEVPLSLSTGIQSLDEIIAPSYLPNGSLVAIGARPKMGKTSFLVKMAEHIALDLNQAILSFSLEMSGSQLTERILVTKAGIASDVLHQTARELDDADQQGRHGVRTLFDHEFGLIDNAISQYEKSAYYLDDRPHVSIDHIERQSRLLAEQLSKDNKKLGAVMVDYLTLMKTTDAERRDLALADITRRLKLLAKELNCIVVVVTQLNRNLEQRQDKRPLPSDSRDTGQIEQDCDLWIGLYRDSFYHQPELGIPAGLTEIIVRLNRHGGTGTAYCLMDGGSIKPYQGSIPKQQTSPINAKQRMKDIRKSKDEF